MWYSARCGEARAGQSYAGVMRTEDAVGFDVPYELHTDRSAESLLGVPFVASDVTAALSASVAHAAVSGSGGVIGTVRAALNRISIKARSRLDLSRSGRS